MEKELLRNLTTHKESLWILLDIFFSSLIKAIIAFAKSALPSVLCPLLQVVEAGILTAWEPMHDSIVRMELPWTF
jgi:hypothetical protein